MYDFKPGDSSDSAEHFRQLVEAAQALTEGEPDPVANMANVAALLWEFLPDLNWAGFYRIAPAKARPEAGPETGPETGNAQELVLGPFVGRPACIRIPIGQGVCGAAAASGETQRVDDVHAFPGHIACDAASQSELVVPVLSAGEVVAVIDLDSPTAARFTDEDAKGIEALARMLSGRV
ncbi:MAG: GAF domain-containing protein [Pseudomonadota bacterium]